MRARVHIILREILAGKPAVNRYCTVCGLLHEAAWTTEGECPAISKNTVHRDLATLVFGHLITANRGDVKIATTCMQAAVMMLEVLTDEEQLYLWDRLESLYVKTQQA